jgi:hypothetical protein
VVVFVESLEVLRQRISVLVIAASLTLPAVVGCLTAGAAQERTMACCAESSCAHGHGKGTCFSRTAPTNSSEAPPEQRISLTTPLPAGAAQWSAAVHILAVFDCNASGAADPLQHSPPELYTLHGTLLI